MKVEIEISEQAIRNVLESAGRMASTWCESDLPLVEALQDRTVMITLIESKPGDRYALHRRVIAEGIRKCAELSPHVFKALLENRCDGPQSDVLLQYMLFGKVLFA